MKRIVARVLVQTLALLLLTSAGLQAGPLIVLDLAPLPTPLHPMELGESPQGIHLSAFIVERLGRFEVANNAMVLGLFQEPRTGTSATWQLRLRPGIEWSDGVALTASDIASSFRRLLARASSPGSSVYCRALARSLFLVKQLRPIGSTVVEVVFEQPVHSSELAPLLGALPIVPERLGDTDLNSTGAPTLGPYSVQSRSENAINLKANIRYYRGNPAIAEVSYRGTTFEQVEATVEIEGSDHVIVAMSPTMRDRINRQSGMEVRLANSHRRLYVGFSLQRNSIFSSNAELRQLVANAIETTTLLANVPDADTSRIPLAGPYMGITDPTERSSRREPTLYDPFVSLGYSRMGEFYRKSDGGALTVRLAVCAYLPAAQLLGQLLLEQLKRAGIDARLEMIDRTLTHAILSGTPHPFDLLVHEWALDESEDWSPVFHTAGEYNFLGYSNAEVDRRLVLERRAGLPGSRSLYRHQISELLARDRPVLFLWERSDVVAFHNNIKNVPPLDAYYLFRDVYLWAFSGADTARADESTGSGSGAGGLP